MAKRSIVVNQKQYFLPDHIDTQAYLDYCDVQDTLDSVTNYRRKHFEQMAEAVCHVYGDSLPWTTCWPLHTGWNRRKFSPSLRRWNFM